MSCDIVVSSLNVLQLYLQGAAKVILALRLGFLCRTNHDWLTVTQWDVTIGGELSKREGVLFHWWPFSSKRNDRLQLFYADISLI